MPTDSAPLTRESLDRVREAMEEAAGCPPLPVVIPQEVVDAAGWPPDDVALMRWAAFRFPGEWALVVAIVMRAAEVEPDAD